MQQNLRVVKEKEQRKCPYLDTIDREKLDFDLEKECSISLSHKNVYICLVCGTYLQGRGENSYAYTHSLEQDHHVFLNVETKKIYCLPDNYEVFDASLSDIQMALDPEYTIQDIAKLDSNQRVYRVPSRDEYLPGMMGMNVIGKADYINVVVEALSHVGPFRDFFLIPSNYSYSKSPLVHSFGMLMRKLWSHSRFKSQVSPNEFVNEVVRSSKSRYTVNERKDASDFLRWLVNTLRAGLQDKEHKTTVIDQCFRGKIEIVSKKFTLAETKKRSHAEMESGSLIPPKEEVNYTDYDVTTTTSTSDFLMLSLDLPPIALFKNENKDMVVQQVPLYTLLDKYNGEKATKQIWDNIEKTYRIISLPKFLLLHTQRFTKNEFYYEKNTSIVRFPIRNLEVKDYFFPPQRVATKAIVMKMSATPLRAFITQNGEDFPENASEAQLRKQALDMVESRPTLLPVMTCTKYDLVANICHDVEVKDAGGERQKKVGVQSNPVESGCYRVHLRNFADNKWYEVQELIVKKAEPDLVSVSESSILVYQQQS